MSVHTTTHHVGKTDLGLEPFDLSPDISEDVLRAIVHLLGYHNATEFWKPLQTDVDGRLLVSTADIEVTTFETSRVTVGVAAGLVLDQNTSRRQYILQNLGPGIIYIGPTDAVTVNTGFPIGVNSSFSDDVYVGNIYAISSAVNTAVAVLEV